MLLSVFFSLVHPVFRFSYPGPPARRLQPWGPKWGGCSVRRARYVPGMTQFASKSEYGRKRGCLTSLDGPLKFFLVPKSIKWIVLITNKVQIFCRIRDDFLYLKNERYAVRAVYLSRDQLNIRITIDKQSRCVHIVRGP